MLRNIVAIFVGLVIGLVLNAGIAWLDFYVLYPVPEGLNIFDSTQVAEFNAFLATLSGNPTPFVVVLLAHLGQSFVGGWVAARLGASRPMLLAMIVGTVSLALGIMAMQSITEGPDWMVVELPLYLVVAWLAGRIEQKRRAGQSA